MAFFQLVWKANKLKSIREKYHDEKLQSMELAKGGKVHYTLGRRIRHQKILLKRKIKKLCGKLTSCPENSWLHKKAVLLRTEGTLENYILKSICGFISGILLTYMFFIFFVFQLHFGLASATLLCSIIGIVLTVGLAFSPYVRCIVMLFLPQFFSRRGRQALMAYAIILALTGPVKNTLHNVGVLAESLACGQEQLKEAVKAVIDLVKQPFYALRDSLARIIKSIKAIVKRIKETLLAMKRLVLSILRVIMSVFEWLGNIVNICNKRLGTPYDRCQSVFENAVTDCRAKLGPLFDNVCKLASVASIVCYALKPLDLICVLVSYVSDAIVGVVRKKIRRFTQEIRAMFYVKIKFSHSFQMETNKSQTLSEISTAISSEIKRKTDRFLSIFDWVGFMTSFFFILLVVRVIYYRYKWLTHDRFDNRYITKYVREIDLKRAHQDKETIFPLNHRERDKYAALTSILLIRPERLRLAKSFVFLGMTSLKLAIYMTIDYCLFWLLDTIRYHGRTDVKVQRPSYSSSVEVTGNGFLAEIYRSVARAFSPNTAISEIETIPCLPEPKPPDYDLYVQIATLAAFCWVMALFEPYGLRLRHTVLNSYYPDRAKQRAVWLYNQIIRSRGSFLKYARRQLRRQFGTTQGDGIERVTLKERIWAVLPILNRISRLKVGNVCLVCGTPERDKSAPHVRCPTPNCPGVYCPQCFLDLHKLCTVCKSPLDYGDLTDISEERDSSDDQIDISRLKKIPFQSETADDQKIDDGKLKGQVKTEVSSLQMDTSDDDSSKYSYSYQDEPSEDLAIPCKIKFRDVEAQEARDDVTMQIFSEPLLCEQVSTSGDDYQINCFGFSKRKKSSKAKKKLTAGSDRASDSSSIADTESWPTIVVDDKDQTILDIEMEDFRSCSSEQPLLIDCKNKTKHKRSRFKGFFRAFKKIIPFRKKRCDFKDSIQTGNESDGSSSSVSSLHTDSYELLALWKNENNSGMRQSVLRKRNCSKSLDDEHSSCACRKSSRESRKSLRKKGESYSRQKYCYAHTQKFKTKEIPRHLKTVCSNTKYFEIDESSSYCSPKEEIQFRDHFSTYTESLTSVDSDPSRDRRSSTNDDTNDSYIYTSENDNEKRYETHTPTSDSFMTEDIEFSEMSTDNSYTKKLLQICNDRNSSDVRNLSEEDKINEDSDEKGMTRKGQSKPEKTKLYDSLAGLEWSDIDDKSKGSQLQKFNAKFSQRIKKSPEKKLVTNDEADALRRDKVDKETANAMRKSSLKQEKSSNFSNVVNKVDKSVGVKEEDIKHGVKKADKNSSTVEQYMRPNVHGRIGGGTNLPGRSHEKEDQQKLVRGFQPIILQRDRQSVHRSQRRATSNDESNKSTNERNVTGATQYEQEAVVQSRTRDQGTYVRSKTKKCAVRREVNIGTNDS